MNGAARGGRPLGIQHHCEAIHGGKYGEAVPGAPLARPALPAQCELRHQIAAARGHLAVTTFPFVVVTMKLLLPLVMGRRLLGIHPASIAWRI